MSGLFTISLLLTAVTPTALTQVGWRYYIVFAVLSAVAFVIIFIWWPEVSLCQIGLGIENKAANILTLDTRVHTRATRGGLW